MKKKIFVAALMVQSSSLLFAQNSRSDINSLLSSWIIPVVGLLMFVGFAVLVIANFDGIRGKNGTDSNEAWMSVGKGMIYVVLGVAAFGWVASKLASMNFQV